MAQPPRTVDVEGRRFRVTNLDKVLYPATGTTKGEVIAYYQHVARWMVPHVSWRAATRKRWPNGVGTPASPGMSFFEKNLQTKSAPEWVLTVDIEHDDGVNTYPLINDAATLAWLAQLAALEIHVPQWRVDVEGRSQTPDRLVLDLDPGEGAVMAQVAELAHLLREILDDAGMPSVPVTSGSKGIHLYAALDGTLSSDDASSLARELAQNLQQMRPDLVVSDMKKSLRGGKILLDWSQNNASKTTIAPYSLRGRTHPTVAAPRHWDEVGPDLQQLEFAEVLERLERDGDPFGQLPGTVPPSTTGEDRLARYRSMRDPDRTPEPVPSEAPTPRDHQTFVIQEHHARRLHYDVRLERDGVLVSWAVPKGPPTDPTTNHLAVQTEDHPLQYATFEGSIPAGEYGAGKVRIFDHGTYELEKWRDGKEVIVTLHGQAAGGLGGVPRRYALLATKLGGDEKNWLMHLMADDGVATGDDVAEVIELPQPEAGEQSGALDALPHIEPMLATPAALRDFDTGEWEFELKWDGYRCIAEVADGVVRLRSRNGLNLTDSYPELRELGSLVGAHRAVLDGEIVVLDDDGVSRFELLQTRSENRREAHLMLFDLLHLDGRSLVRRPWEERRRELEGLFDGTDGHLIHVPDTLGDDARLAFDISADVGAEGIVGKSRDSVYQPARRARTWLKLRHGRVQDVVVIGFTPGKNSRARTLGALLVAVHSGGRLRYAGKVGSGLSDQGLRDAADLLGDLKQDHPAVDDIPALDARGATWVEPLLVGEASFTEWTSSGRLRQPVWRGWRPDVPAEHVERHE